MRGLSKESFSEASLTVPTVSKYFIVNHNAPLDIDCNPLQTNQPINSGPFNSPLLMECLVAILQYSLLRLRNFSSV